MTAPPEHFADRPATPAELLRPPQEFADPPALEDAALGLNTYGRPHDLLSELLRSVRLSGERIVAYAPVRTFSISFTDFGTLDIIEEGELVLRIEGDPHVERVSRGDVILLPRGDPHHISDAARVRARCARMRRASRPRSSCAARAAKRSKGSKWPAGCSYSRCKRPLKDRR
jgi:hypothetical protein